MRDISGEELQEEIAACQDILAEFFQKADWFPVATDNHTGSSINASLEKFCMEYGYDEFLEPNPKHQNGFGLALSKTLYKCSAEQRMFVGKDEKLYRIGLHYSASPYDNTWYYEARLVDE